MKWTGRTAKKAQENERERGKGSEPECVQKKKREQLFAYPAGHQAIDILIL